MGQLLVIGSTCVDVLIRLERLPVTGEDLQPSSQRFSIGGCGWNVFRAARSTGAAPVFLSPVGTGVYGDMAADALAREGVAVPVRADEPNGCCYCLVEADGERTFLSVHGAEYRIRRPWLDALDGPFDRAYVCGMELQEDTGPDILSWLEAHRETEPFYAPGPRGVLLDQRRIFALRPVIHLNAAEAAVLTGQRDPEAAVRRLAAAAGNLAVVTLGPEGCLAGTPEGEPLRVPAPRVTVRDTVGAGDTHAGVLLGALDQGAALEPALALANAAAARTVSRTGADIPNHLERTWNHGTVGPIPETPD